MGGGALLGVLAICRVAVHAVRREVGRSRIVPQSYLTTSRIQQHQGPAAHHAGHTCKAPRALGKCLGTAGSSMLPLAAGSAAAGQAAGGWCSMVVVGNCRLVPADLSSNHRQGRRGCEA